MTFWTPAEITTALWLDASDASTITLDASDNVEQWADKSGEDRHFSQSSSTIRPAYDSVNEKITFDGVDEFLTAGSNYLYSDNTNTGLTIFAVADSTGTNTIPFLFDFGTMAGSGYGLGFSRTNYFAYTPTSYGGAAQNSTISVASGSVNLVCLKITFGSEMRQYLNATSITDTAITLSKLTAVEIDEAASRGLGGPPCIGAQSKTGLESDRFFVGSVREVIVLRETVSDTDRQIIEGYLAWKWGFADALPIDHPYKEAAPVLIGGETIEDISLDLSAYYQARDNLSTILSATDGQAFQDLEAILKVYGQSIDDLSAELAAYYQDRQDIATALKTFATGYKDLPTALQTIGLGRADFPAQLKALAWAGKDLSTVLAAVTPLVFRDLGLSLSATDGTTINDLSTVLAAVKRAPQYRSVVAQRVRSVISEVS